MKRKFIFVSVGLIVIILLGIGVSYSLWNISVSQDTVNVATTKCFNVEITSQKNSISLENAYPISNENGKKLTPFSFTITNTCDIFASYTVSLESLKGTTLSSKFLNAMINNEEIKKLSDYETTDTVNAGSIESHVLAKGSLGSGDSEDYTLRVWIDYNTTMEDLNNETKTFKSKIVVKAQPSSWSPVNEGYTTLHDAILANEYQTRPEKAIEKIVAKGTPDLSKTAPISEDDLSDKGLYKLVDDYGDTYYYRGKVNNNNVYFAGFYWQIIRINGDGSIRLIYNGAEKNAQGEEKILGEIAFNYQSNKAAYVGYMYGDQEGTTNDEVHSNINNSNIKDYLDNWYQNRIAKFGYDKYLSTNTGFCGDRSFSNGNGLSSGTEFGTYYRYKNNLPSLICKNKLRDLYTTMEADNGNNALEYPISLTTYDELNLAGITGASNYLNYLYSGTRMWTISPVNLQWNVNTLYCFIMALDNNGAFYKSWTPSNALGVRPVINLKSDVKISGGIGTINDPFVVE